jgi:hypothetical protein
VIELNLEDIQYDYAGKYNDPCYYFFRWQNWAHGHINTIEEAKQTTTSTINGNFSIR